MTDCIINLDGHQGMIMVFFCLLFFFYTDDHPVSISSMLTCHALKHATESTQQSHNSGTHTFTWQRQPFSTLPVSPPWGLFLPLCHLSEGTWMQRPCVNSAAQLIHWWPYKWLAIMLWGCPWHRAQWSVGAEGGAGKPGVGGGGGAGGGRVEEGWFWHWPNSQEHNRVTIALFSHGTRFLGAWWRERAQWRFLKKRLQIDFWRDGGS